MKRRLPNSKVLLSILFLFLATISLQAATITSTTTGGSWSSTTTWVGNVVPLTTDAVVIATSGTSQVTGTSTTCASLVVNSGSILSMGTSRLTISGLVNNAGTITVSSGRLTQSGTGDFTNSGTVTYSGTGRLYLTGSLINTGTLTLGSTAVYFTGANASASTCNAFTTTGTVTFQRTAGTVTLVGNTKGAALSVNGTGGTLNLGAGLNHTFTGAITLSAGTLNGGSSTLNASLAGTVWTYSAGTFTAGTGTVNLSAAGAQTLTGTVTSVFNNLTFSGSGLKTLTRVPTVNGILSMEGTATVSAAPTYGTASTLQYKGTSSITTGVEFPAAFAGTGGLIIDQGTGNTVTLNASKIALAGNLNIKSGILNLSTFTANRAAAGGTLTVANGATLKIGGTNPLPTNYSTHVIGTTSTVDYAGAAQTVTVPNSSQTYGNLTLSGSGVKTLQVGMTSISNNLTLSGTASATGVVGLAVSGNIDIQTSSTFSAGAFTHTVGGTWTNSGTFVSTGSTVNFNGSNSASISSSNFNHVIFSGAGTKTATGALSISGNTTISNNFNAGSFTHTLGGDLTNNGSFTPGTSTILFNGSSAQNLNGSTVTTFNNLTMNGTGGVTLGNGSVVSGSLTLTSGILTLGNFGLTAGVVSGGSATSFVKTNGSGLLKRTVTTGSAAIFPVGNSAYNPITLTNTTAGNTDNYSIRVLDGAITNSNVNAKTVNREWQVKEDVAGGSALTVEATYNVGEVGGSFNAATTPSFGLFNGANWYAPLSATASGTGPYIFTSGTGAFAYGDLTSATNYLGLGSGDAFNASKLVIASINPASPFVNQNNVTVTVQSKNSNNVLTNVATSTGFGLTATNTTLSGTSTGTLVANSYETTVSSVGFITTSTTATVTATQSSGDILSAGTSGTFSVVVGNIYKPNAVTANWGDAIWLQSIDGGGSWTGPTSKTDFGVSDEVLVPSGYTLTANTNASVYNVQIDAGGTLAISPSVTITLNHTGGSDFGFHVSGTFQNSGTFTNSNNAYPLIISGGTYIHAKDGGSIPVANWSNSATCQVTGITSTALTAGLNQNFQNFTWNNASQAVIQNLTSDDMTVNGTLALMNGVLTTGSNRVIIAATGTATSSNNARINGNLRRFVPNATAPSIAFPIGDANYYTPATIAFAGTTAGSGHLDASTSAGQAPTAAGLSTTKYINRLWTISNAGVSGFTSYSPTFTFVDADKIGSPNTSALEIRKLNGNTWATTTIGTLTANSTQCTGLTSFSTFAIGESNCSSISTTWMGGISTDWNTAGNWCYGAVPSSIVDVVIPAGPTNQPIIGATAYCKSITIEATASLTITGSNTLNVSGNWTAAGNFIPGSGTVAFVGTTTQTIQSNTTFNNLTINNVAGAISNNNLTVNGILNLQSTNPSTSAGTLSMGANTLNMGSSSSSTGTGDVTGTINRTHTFTTSVFYSFGNQNTGVTFATMSGQTLPSSISVKVSIGTAPDWSGSKGTAIVTPLKRIYEASQTGGNGTSALLRVHYNDNEYTGLNESKFSLWEHSKIAGEFWVQELGKSNQDVVNNYLTIQDVDFADIPATMGDFQMTIAPTQATILTWNGSISTDWNATSNWTPNAVPSPDYGVLIPDASTTSFDPTFGVGDSCISVVIEAGGILNSSSDATLALTGTEAVWSKQVGGVFNEGNSTVIISSLADYASIVGSTDFWNLTIADGAKLRPSADSYTGIKGTLSLSTTGVLAAATNHNTFEFKGTDQSIPAANGSTPGYHNLTISNTGTKTLPAQVTIMGNYTNNGTVDALTNASTILLNGIDVQAIGGSTQTTFNNLTISNSFGVVASNSLTVNGILNLATANPSTTKGLLDLVTAWNDYPGTSNLNPGVGNSSSYYLNMGATATTIGVGDVTGIVKRTTLVANTAYTYGNQYTTVLLTNGIMPSALTVTIKLGASAPGKTSSVQRHYEIVPLTSNNETFSSTSRLSVNFHYLDSELNGNTESKLVTGDYDIGNPSNPAPDEHGRSAYDFTDNFVGFSNVPISYFIKKTDHEWRTIFFLNDYEEGYKTWNGSISTEWGIATNWTPSGTPSEGSFIIIPNVLSTNGRSPVLPSSVSVNTMTIEPGGILNMGTSTLTILNTLSAGWEDQNVPGNDPGTSKVIFGNPGATVSGASRFYDVEIAQGADVTLSSASTMTIGNSITKTGTGTGLFYADSYDGTVEYSKSGDQTVILPDGTPHYHNLILSGSGIKTLPAATLNLHGNLTTSGSVSVVPTNPLSIEGDLVIGSGTSFTAGALTHTVGGAITNAGTFTTTGSTFKLNGTSAQTLADGVALPSYIIDNAAGVAVSADATIADLTINSGKLFQVNAGKHVTIGTSFTNNGTLKLQSDYSNGTATLLTPAVIGGTGSYTVQQQISGMGGSTPNNRFWYLSSPLGNASTSAFDLSSTDPVNKLWTYSELNHAYFPITTTLPLAVGTGYVARLGADKIVSLSGTSLNNGDKNISVTRQNDENAKRGYNLVGNPYPSFVTLDLADNSTIESTLWYRTILASGAGMAFDTYNFDSKAYVSGSGNGAISEFIPPLQAFWVRVKAVGTTNVAFKQANRSHQTGIALRNAEVSDAQTIRLYVTNGAYKDETLIGFYDRALDGYDSYDSPKMSNETASFPELFTLAGTEQVAINGLAPLAQSKEIALGFRTGVTGTFTLKASEIVNMDGCSAIILKDKLLNTSQDLLSSSDYTFTSGVTASTDRFSLLISKTATSISSEKAKPDFSVLAGQNGSIQVKLFNLDANGTSIHIYSISGQLLISTEAVGSESTIQTNLPKGFYFLEVTGKEFSGMKKVNFNL
jgi:hypothetical protein